MNAPARTALIIDDDELMRMMLAAALGGLVARYRAKDTGRDRVVTFGPG